MSNSRCSASAIGFRSDQFYPFVKFSMFGTSHLLASVGGFLSLIAGVSVISLFEIFYFLGCKKLKSNKVSDDNQQTEVKKSKNSLLEFSKKHCNFSTIHGMGNTSEGKVFW